MPIIYFDNYEFTLITDKDGKPWWVAKELCDYLEQGRDTLLRQVGLLTGKWQFFL